MYRWWRPVPLTSHADAALQLTRHACVVLHATRRSVWCSIPTHPGVLVWRQACGRAGSYEKAYALLREMEYRGLHPDQVRDECWWPPGALAR
jgi:pentatricopeptide repeat protein